MSGVTGPNMVTDGMIFMLDAANPQCFVSGNTTAVDLIGGSLCTGANGNPGNGTHVPNAGMFPTYDSTAGGVFSFSNDGINIENDLGTATASSVVAWVYYTGGTDYLFDGRADGGSWLLFAYSSANINWHYALSYNFDTTYNASSTYFLNQWIHVVATSDSTDSRLYLNGIRNGSAPNGNIVSQSSSNENFGKNYRIGTRFTTATHFSGKMGPIYFYNRKITEAEALQNYNAHKSRFGL
jgi:hypothetical protein